MLSRIHLARSITKSNLAVLVFPFTGIAGTKDLDLAARVPISSDALSECCCRELVRIALRTRRRAQHYGL